MRGLDPAMVRLVMTENSARDEILDRVRAALRPEAERTPYPDYDPADAVAAGRLTGSSRLKSFENNLAAVNGRLITGAAALARFLADAGHLHGVCDPELEVGLRAPLEAAGLTMETSFDRSRYDDYAFGITRATAAIAESGTVVIDDDGTFDRLAALAPWVHIAVLQEPDIILTVAEAAQQLGDKRNTIWCTGPSKTADVEGILIEGVHGPGEQVVLIL